MNYVKSAQKSGGLSDHHFLKSGGPTENPVASGTDHPSFLSLFTPRHSYVPKQHAIRRGIEYFIHAHVLKNHNFSVFSGGRIRPNLSKGSSTFQYLSLEPITKSLGPFVQKFQPVQESHDRQTDTPTLQAANFMFGQN